MMVTRKARFSAIVDNDFAGDPDGLVSLAHLALAPAVDLVLVTTTPVDPKLADAAGISASDTAESGRDLALEMFDVAGITAPEVVAGGQPGESRPGRAAAAIATVTAGNLPLVILCGGPLTNIAAALRLRPGLADDAALVWIGGTRADGDPEYNFDTDPAAAAAVLGSGIPIVQVPREEYERQRVSIAEIEADLAGTGLLGRWLAEKLLDVPPFVTLHGAITLGDCALASVAALEPHHLAGADRMTLVQGLDNRLVWADFLALLRLHRHTPTPHPRDTKGTS